VEHAVHVAHVGHAGAHVGLDEREARLAREVREVGGAAGEEVVDADHRVPVGEEAVDEVRRRGTRPRP
jgi:hypothetical protein